MDPRLEQAQTPDGEKRFYPPGQHPATWRVRAQLAKMETMRLAYGPNPQVEKWIEYLKEQIARFEEKHSEDKVRYLKLLERR